MRLRLEALNNRAPRACTPQQWSPDGDLAVRGFAPRSLGNLSVSSLVRAETQSPFITELEGTVPSKLQGATCCHGELGEALNQDGLRRASPPKAVSLGLS